MLSPLLHLAKQPPSSGDRGWLLPGPSVTTTAPLRQRFRSPPSLPSLLYQSLLVSWIGVFGCWTWFLSIFQEGTYRPFLTVLLQYFFLLLLLLVSTPVNASCGAGFSWLHLWTSDGIATEQTTWRAPKFSHLSRTASIIHSPHAGLSSRVLQSPSAEVTCLYFLW